MSIATRILPRAFFIQTAELDVPSNRHARIAARVAFRDTAGVPIAMDLDFLQEGPQSWYIEVKTDEGSITLSNGGAVLSIDGDATVSTDAALPGEYPGLYHRFAEIVASGVSDVDVSPLRLVADTFLRARINRVTEFHEE